jgi:hypothetical protein
VRFEVEHHFDAPLDVIEAASLDSAFYERLVLPGVTTPRVLERREDGNVVHLRVRYEFTGELPSVARTVLGTSRLQWVNASVADRATHHTEFQVIPDVHAERLACRGTIQLTGDRDHTTRHFTVDLKVKVPLLAGRAERAISSGLIERLDVEAKALAAFVAH